MERGLCDWCATDMQDIGRGSYDPMRVLLCPACGHEAEYVPHDDEKVTE